MTTHFHRALIVGALCAFAGTSFAQMQMGNNGGMNGMGGMNGNRQNMTPAQREAMRAQMRENQIRAAMTNAGYGDAATQDPVIALAKQEQATASGLTSKISAMRTAFQNNSDEKTVSGLLDDYRSAVADAQKGRQSAIDDLDKSISFSTKPKLEALLTMLGIIGDETGFVANLAGQAQLPGANNGGPGGMGGGGGMMGGGPGGMGGGMMGGNGGPPMPPDGN